MRKGGDGVRAHGCACSILYSSTVKANESVTGTYVGVAAKTVDWPPIVQEKKRKKKIIKKRSWQLGKRTNVRAWYDGGVCA
jgi:hypothetical protein